MALSKDDILNAIAEMSVMDIVALISAMEEKFGVTAAAAVAVGPATLSQHRRNDDDDGPGARADTFSQPRLGQRARTVRVVDWRSGA